MPIPLVTRILVADDHAIVRSGLKKILDKLGMRDRVELTRYAIKRGLIQP